MCFWVRPKTDGIFPIIVCYELDRKFHSNDFLITEHVENLKLQFKHNSLHLCLLCLVLLWLRFLISNGCSEKYHGKKLQRTKK